MYTKTLPVKLKQNVIVDAVFELRFTAQQGFSDLLPGSIRQIYGDVKTIEKMPVAELPSHIREMDLNLQYQPLMKMVWEEITLIIGDRTLGIGYGNKYPGWATFKNHLQKLFDCLISSQLSMMVDTIERYSFKYIDFIPKSHYEELSEPFLVSVQLGAKEIVNSAMKLQIERQEEFGVSLFEFSTPVKAEIENCPVAEGTIISIDTVRFSNQNWDGFLKDFNDFSEKIHMVNKKCFFDALSEELIANLGAEYE